MIYVACLPDKAEEVILQGNEPLVSLEELYQVLPNKDLRELEITSDFIEHYMTAQGALNLKLQIRQINPYASVTLPPKYENYFAPGVQSLGSISCVEDAISYFVHGGRQSIELLRHLVTHYTERNEEALANASKIATLQLEKEQAMLELKQQKDITRKHLQEKEELQTMLETLTSRIRYRYGKDVNTQEMLEIDTINTTLHSILYIKEITRVRFTDTFLHYLQECLKSVSGVATRFVVIESPLGFTKASLYPECANKAELTNQDVYGGNIFMAGFDEKIMQTVIRNPSKAPYLIVLDRSGQAKPFLHGPKVHVLYTASDPEDIKETCSLLSVISHRKETLNIPFIRDFRELTDSEKLQRYSSMPIVRACMELLEGGDN